MCVLAYILYDIYSFVSFFDFISFDKNQWIIDNYADDDVFDTLCKDNWSVTLFNLK